MLQFIRNLKDDDPEGNLDALRESRDQACLEALRGQPSPETTRGYEDYLRPVLERLADEQAAFYTTFAHDRASVFHALRTLYEHEALRTGDDGHLATPDVAARGCLGFLLFAMDTILAAQEPESLPQRQGYSVDSLTELIRDPPVREVFAALYDPGDQIEQEARQFWEELRSDRMEIEFFRYGTTSFLLLCEARGRGKRVLKCVQVAFQSISALSDDAASYSGRISRIREAIREIEPDRDLVAQVDWSTRKWILMEHIDGPTLREELDELGDQRVDSQSENSTQQVIDWFKTYALPVIEGIELLHQANFDHLDLSPPNIILVPTEASGFQVRFIDLGRNYLASESIGIVRTKERNYVAPEIRSLGPEVKTPSSQEADLYSFGCLLSELCVGELPDEAGRVPEELFSTAPFIGRLVQDLVDRSPSNRLLLARASPDVGPTASFRFARWVRLHLEEAIRSMSELVKAGQAGKERRFVPYVYVWPAMQQVRQLVLHLGKELWSGRRQPKKMGRELRSGLAWSLLCLIGFTLSVVVTVGLFVDTLKECRGLPWPALKFVRVETPEFLSPAQKCEIENQLYQVQLLGFTASFAMLGYYQGIFARLWIPKAIDRKSWLERATRASMRGTAVAPFGLILVGVIWGYDWAYWLVAAGFFYVAINNNLSHRLRLRSLNQAKESPSLSAIPERRQFRNDILAGWCVGMPFVATVVLLGAVMLEMIWGRNSPPAALLWTFAVILAAWNAYMFFSRADPRSCAEVRGHLSLAFALGERASCRKSIQAAQDAGKEMEAPLAVSSS